MVSTSHRPMRADELSAVGTDTSDSSLRALEVAIYVEESLGVVLPDPTLDEAHLGSPEAVRETVTALGGGL